MHRIIAGLCFSALLASAPAAGQDDGVGEPTEDRAAVDEGNDLASFEPAVSVAPDEFGDDAPAEPLTAQGGDRGTPGVMDELDLGATEVIGNQELPRVLYIVPWKQSEPGDLMGQPANTLLDDVLAPVDRREFTREVDYYGDLFLEDEAKQ